MNEGIGLCWCASDIRCPHGISQKLPPIWDDMEKVNSIRLDVLYLFEFRLFELDN